MRCTGINIEGVPCEVRDLKPGYSFCYLCGTLVPKEMKVPPRAIPPLSEPEFKGCLSCGSERYNAKGVCTNCGAYSKPPLRENYFIELSRGEAVRCALGMKHERNDDFGIVATRLVRGEEIRWMIVCDGLSLSQNPHLASEAAAKAASTMIERMVIDGLSDYENVVEQSIIAAQNAVLKVPLEKLKGAKAAEKLPPGMTTITVVLLAGGKAHFGWAGDSRIYAILTQDGRCGAIRLTRDDTRLNELLDQGLSLEKATLDPNNAAMTQCLGPLDDCHSLVPHYAEIPLDQVAAVISMTDGAYFTVDPKGDDQPLDELAQLYAANITSARSLVEELTELANSRGGPDNITVAALFLKPK